ncbi:helix-turn-helix domain-containing protein [Aquimonas sp.]|jgi:transcriptional regulator with XRE-family HTH domain|uniref:helix-turn-helix domain-containing protein n=1 Tax=Aquimonas sp. TaxID=1872588 RepID=UPI0037BE3CB6
METTAPFGQLLREWRQRRRLSQLELALEAEVSTRHLSFIETGRARPSRGLLLHLGELLELPLRERNRWLLAAGFAPQFAETPLQSTPLQQAQEAVQRVLELHDPYPAVAVDRHWNLLMANTAAQRLLTGVAPELLQPQANVLRVSLHPQGLGPRIINLAEWRQHLLARLRRQVTMSGDAVLRSLLAELAAYPPLPHECAKLPHESPHPDVLMLFRLHSPLGELALFSTITVFGTPTDITLSELALEAFYPADAQTAERLRQLAQATMPPS